MVQSQSLDPEYARAIARYQIARQNDALFQIQRNQRVLAWQDMTTKVTFVLVILIVLAGLCLSAIQFRKLSNIDLSVSTQGVHLTTSLVGVAILTLSIAFLDLYLVFVYPIKLIGH